MDHNANPPPRVVCVGGAALDHSYRAAGPLVRDSSNPARRRTGFGGVARNVAEALRRLGIESALVSAVGDDSAGRLIVESLVALGVDVSQLTCVPDALTASYVAILAPDGALELGLADMAVFDALTPERIVAARHLLHPGGWVFADGNLTQASLSALAALVEEAGCRLALDAVSVAKAPHLAVVLDRASVVFLNRDEAQVLLPGIEAEPPEILATGLVARGARTVVLTAGAAGAIVASRDGAWRIPAVRAVLNDVTGAGDALVAATLARLAGGDDLVEAVRVGTLAAALTIEVPGAVRDDLSDALLRASRGRLPPLSWDP